MGDPKSLSESVVTPGPASGARGPNYPKREASLGRSATRFATVPVAPLGTADPQRRPHVVVVTFVVEESGLSNRDSH